MTRALHGAREQRLVVVWRVTDRCNLACGFCAHDSRLRYERKQVQRGTVLRFGSLLQSYSHQLKSSTHLSLLGGEPMLWPPLSGIEAQLSSMGLSLGITTNGTTLHVRKVRARLLSHYDEVTVSVDGIGAVHDDLRGHANGFAALRRGICQLTAERGVSVRPRVRVNSVLMRHTVANFADLCRELASWGVDEITFNELGGRDRPEFYPANRLRVHDVAALGRQLAALARELSAAGVQLRGGPEYVQRMTQSALDVPWPVADCRPGERFLFIDPEGRVAPCNFTSSEYAVHVDELSTVGDLLALPERFTAARQQRTAAACGDCRSTQVFAKYHQSPIEAQRLTRRLGVFAHGG